MGEARSVGRDGKAGHVDRMSRIRVRHEPEMDGLGN